MPFAKFVNVLSLDGGMRVASLPNASVIQVLEILRPVKIEEVRVGVLSVPFCHIEFQWQKVRHRNFRVFCSKVAENSVVMPPEFIRVVLHVFPMDSVEPARCPQYFVRNFGCSGRMLVFEIAHAHTTCDTICDAVFKQLDVRNSPCFGEEVLYFTFRSSEFLIRSKAPQIFGDDVVVSEAHINRTVFFGNELQELHISKVIVRDIARNTAGISRQEVAFKVVFEIFA